MPQKRHLAPKLSWGAIDMVERTSRPRLGATLGNQPDAMDITPHLQGFFFMRPLRTALFLATALAAAPLSFIPVSPASAQIGISVNIDVAPPELPVYEQPPLPAEGWLWQPGFWAYGDEGYYWVPGTWVQPPRPGVLWTPGYWGFNNGAYVFNEGYWGPHVGFYGGINYGYGYNGGGFFGGEWRGGVFAYNREAVRNFGGVHVTNVYNRTIVVNRVTNVSFNGGRGGIQARPTPEQQQFAHEPHIQRTADQVAHIHAAAQNRELLASANHGHPPIAATARPNEFKGPGVVPAREAVVSHAAGRPPAGQTARPGAEARHGAVARPEAAAPHARPEAAARPEVGARPRVDAPRPEAARPEAARPEAARPDVARPEAARPKVARPEVARPEAARPEVARPEVARPEVARPEVARPEVARPAPRPEAPRAAAPRPPEARPAPARREEDKPKH